MLFIVRYPKQVLREAIFIASDRQFRSLLSLVVILVVGGALFYSHVEHWSMLNSVYFCVVTLATIGYGDFTPKTDAGKVFTMVYAVFGIGILLGLINLVARHATRRYVKQTDAYFDRTEKAIERIVERVLERRETGS